MSRFRFPLARLAGVRRIQEELERERWLEAEAARRAAEVREARARDAVLAAEAELRRRQADASLGVEGVLHMQAALERARAALQRARERTHTAAYQAELLRAPWEERRKEVRGLERLEARARAVWRREELRREAAELDEVAAQRSHAPARERPIRETSGAATPAPTDLDAPGVVSPQGLRGSFRSTEASPPDRS